MKKRTFLAGAMALALAAGDVLAPSVADAATMHGGGGHGGGGHGGGGFHGGGGHAAVVIASALTAVAACIAAAVMVTAGGMAAITPALADPCSWSWGCAALRPFERGLLVLCRRPSEGVWPGRGEEAGFRSGLTLAG